MTKPQRGRVAAGFAVTLLGVLLGLAVFFALMRPSRGQPSAATPKPPSGNSWDGGKAMRYATAVQKGDCDEITQTTAWMVDRLRRVALETPDPAQIEAAKTDLCNQIRNRPPEGNVLRVEGIEDRYVFAPNATLEVADIDQGRDDLLAPVECRVWIRVTYPKRESAPLVQVQTGSSVMQPVHAWSVGVNISRTDGTVLKANVIGNLEIDYNSLSFSWPTTSSGG